MRHLLEILKLAKLDPLPHQERVKTRFVRDTKPGGGLILKHETGTGKTFSSIHAAQATGKHLIAIVPAALRNNYRKELEDAEFKGSYDVISYHEAMRLHDDPDFIAKARDSVVVYDEAHQTGSEGTKARELARQIKSHKNLALTATPIRNHPSELVPLLRGASSDPSIQSVAQFKKHYIDRQQVNPGILARIRGAKSGIVERPKSVAALSRILKEVVDVQSSADQSEHMPTVSEEQIMVPMSEAQSAAYDAVSAKQPGLQYRLQHGIPPGKDFGKYRAFLTGLRQISNTPQEFQNKDATIVGSKIIKAVDEIQDHSIKVPNYRGYTYSNYMKSGVIPIHNELKRRGITSEIFSGKLKDRERKDIIKRYNKGDIQHLLITSSGSQGLDLKGTKLVQILEPHFNSAKIHQVKARGVRFKSHAHLPKNERHVHIQHFFSHKPQGVASKFFGLKPITYADEAIHQMAKKKDALNNAFLKIINESANA